VVLAAVLLVPTVFTAFMLLPELTIPVASNNDDATHFLLIQRASDALARGENVLDFWVPQLELGFPWFIYYQPLPALAVVFIHRALFGTVDLLTVFNGLRFVLLVGFPLTVFWSLRRMGIGLAGAVLAAAVSPLLSGDFRYGLEYDSYVWRGFGMFTQLVGVHLSFISLAVSWTALRSDSRVALARASLALTALFLSHLLYAYMMAITLAVIVFAGANTRTDALRRAVRLAVIGLPAAVISAWLWLPFRTESAFAGLSPYLQQEKWDSYGAPKILGWLLSGDLLDHGRLPVITGMLAIGIVGALITRTALARSAIVLFLLWLVLYFGKPTLGGLVALLPLHDTMLLHRFIGSVEIFAIVLIGIGAAWVFERLNAQASPQRIALFGVAALALLFPAMNERAAFYSLNSLWMEKTQAAISADVDARTILAAIRAQPPGRVFAGLRTSGWGPNLNFGIPFNSVRFADWLIFNGVPVVASPYSSASLNADLIWDFAVDRKEQYDLFDARYVVAPSGVKVPDFLEPQTRTARYSLYRAPSSGIAEFVELTDRQVIQKQTALFSINRLWFNGVDVAARRFHRFDYPGVTTGASAGKAAGCAQPTYSSEIVQPSRIDVVVACPNSSTLVLKVSYHPNWHVIVDGLEVPAFMTSPSYLGVAFPAGQHTVTAEYRSTPLKTPLFLIGLLVLASVGVYGRPRYLGGPPRTPLNHIGTALLSIARRRGNLLKFEALPRLRLLPQELPDLPRLPRLPTLTNLPRLPNFANALDAAGSSVFARACLAVSVVCALAVSAALVDLAVRAALRLEVRWDTFAYHVPFAALRGGLSIPYEMNDYFQPLYEGFPPLPDLVQGFLWRLTGSLNATGLANYLAFVAFLGYCHFALRAPFWLVGLISLTAPLVLIHTTVSYVDLFGNTFLAIGVASCLYLYLFGERASRLVVLGGLAGLAAAAWSRFLLVPVVALVFCFLALVILTTPYIAGFTRRHAAALLFAFAALAAIPYGKNLAMYGNPFWPIRMPVMAQVFPYQIDPTPAMETQRPPPLKDNGQFSLFVNSLFEINHPTHYEDRPRWTIDQGNAWLAYRMGGFWVFGVITYLLAAITMLVVCARKSGVVASAAFVATLCVVGLLPQSHELRYYMFIPLTWAAAIGMLFSQFRDSFPRAGLGFLVLALVLFVHMVGENAPHYEISRVGYTEAASLSGATDWWKQLEPGRKYCAVDMVPIGILLTGPTMSEYSIVDRSNAAFCPADSIVVTDSGIQGRR
jgi:6-pyruvoyl-tetrahydropterin synthase-like protein